MSLSNIEEKIYFAALGAGPVTFDTINSWGVCSRGTLRVVMHNLVKKGYFWRIKKGTYAAVRKGGKIDDALLIAQNLFDGYIAFSAALYVHNLSDELPFVIYVATKSRSDSRTFGNYTVKAVAMGKRLLGAERLKGISVSSKAKTLYDCFHVPQYAGGYSRILKAVFNSGLSEAEWQEFLYFAGKFESSAFCQRTGYMLSLLAKETKHEVPGFVTDFMRRRVKNMAAMGPGDSGNGKCTRIDEWKIKDFIGKEKLLSWWYHG